MYRVTKITSFQNEVVKRLRRLYTSASFRKKENVFVVEGLREVSRCLRSRHRPQSLFFPSGFDMIHYSRIIGDLGIPMYELSPSIFDRITYRGGENNLLLVAAQAPCTLLDIEVDNCSLILILDAIEKPGNIGAIFRTAAALGVDALLICGPQQVLQSNTIRSSLGHIFGLPYVVDTPQKILDFVKGKNLSIYTSVLRSDALPIYQVDLKKGAAIVLGAEDTGVQHFWVDHAIQTIQIPMLGRDADSLNVSNAAAIMIYEAQKQRYFS